MLSGLRSYTGRASTYQPPSISDPPRVTPDSETARRRRAVRRRQALDSEQIASHPIAVRNGEGVASTSTSTPSLASEAPIGGWLPALESSLFFARSPTQLQPDVATPERPDRASTARSRRRRDNGMTRQRSMNTPASPILPSLGPTVSRSPPPVQSSSSRSRHGSLRVTNPNPTPAEAAQPQLPLSQLPSIRFVPYNDPRSSRPSLAFPTITRTLPNNASTIRVGRYSEKDSAPPDLTPNSISDAPVGFKSKVVSRRHCEFFYMDNQWHIRDVKSSSGTFLNHIRLSPPGEESKPFAIKDGDLVQLGIDFKGGEEMIFRCVKIRILCNRGWQKSVNKFNKSAHKQLNDLARGSSKEFKESTECTICLNSIAPCQSLFVAPCSHTWHYKCIRPMLEEADRVATGFAQFLCPNCRSITDLNADVDEGPLWEEDFSDHDNDEQENLQSQAGMSVDSDTGAAVSNHLEDDLSADLDSLSLRDGFQHPSFGLPPAGTSLSRSSSSMRLNPSASTFVPTSSSALPLPLSPTLPHDSSDSAPLQIPSLGFEAPMLQPSAPNSNRNHHAPFVPLLDVPGVNNLSRRHASPYEHETVSSAESDRDGEYDFGLSPLDQTATISAATSLQYTRLLQSQAEALGLSTRNVANGADHVDSEGPLTPRNNAGPFVFDGGAAPPSGGSSNSRSPEEDGPEPLSLDQAAVA